MRERQAAWFEFGECDKENEPGTGSPLFHINSSSMVFPSDRPDALSGWTVDTVARWRQQPCWRNKFGSLSEFRITSRWAAFILTAVLCMYTTICNDTYKYWTLCTVQCTYMQHVLHIWIPPVRIYFVYVRIENACVRLLIEYVLNMYINTYNTYW